MSKKKDINYKFIGEGLSAKEKHWAEERFYEYVENYPHINNLSSFSLLEELLFLECDRSRIKKKIKSLQQKTKSEDFTLPTTFQKALQDNLSDSLKLQEQLGLKEDPKALDAFKYIEELKDKFDLWKAENQASRQVTCPFCSKLFYLNIRTDKYEAKKYPFFEDKLLFNKPLWQLYKEKRLTAKEVSQILGTSVDYVEWLEELIQKKNSPKKTK
jgi:hypothetical protein